MANLERLKVNLKDRGYDVSYFETAAEATAYLCEKLAGKEDIWYANNIEIYDYIMALRALEFSADRSMVYNPTATDVWVRYDHENVKIPAGKLTRLGTN